MKTKIQPATADDEVIQIEILNMDRAPVVLDEETSRRIFRLAAATNCSIQRTVEKILDGGLRQMEICLGWQIS